VYYIMSEQTITVAKRYFGNKAAGFKVDCYERDYDNKWEMLKLIPDPTLSVEEVNELKARKIPVPYRWVTIEVVDPYVVLGILKSINKEEGFNK